MNREEFDDTWFKLNGFKEKLNVVYLENGDFILADNHDSNIREHEEQIEFYNKRKLVAVISLDKIIDVRSD